MISILRYLSIIGLIALAVTPAEADAPRRVSEEILSTSIGKWQRIQLRWVTHPPDTDGALVLELTEGTRDRDGPGAYLGSIERLMYASTGNFALHRSDASGLHIAITYKEARVPSEIILKTSNHGSGDQQHSKLSITGSGPVYESLMAQLKEIFEYADWVNTLADAEWSYFVPDPNCSLRKEVSVPKARAVEIPQ